MQQKRSGPRRTGQQSSARPRSSGPHQSGQGSRRAYDWTKDRRPSGTKRRTRPQGYQEQVLDFSGTGSSGSSGGSHPAPRTEYRDNSIPFPQQEARRTGQSRPASGARRQGQRPRPNTTAYPGNGSRPRGNTPQGGASRNGGRYRPTQSNLRSPSRREGRKKRRLTRAALRRRRAFRRLTALALLVCVVAAGVYLTVTMLFKINTLQVETEGAVVEEVGGYSSAEILEALGVHAEENIFSFDPAEKAAALEKEFPMLENIQVVRDYPNTVVVKADAATAAYAMQTSGGWLSLSAGLKILDQDSAQPELPVLYGGEPVSTTPGAQLEFALPAQSADSAASSGAASSGASSGEAEEQTDKRLESLNTLMTALDSCGLMPDVTRIEFEDPEQMAFLYQGRISVLLGTLNELDYKLRLARYVLLNEDGKGCSATDTGMLDLSHLSASSTRKFRFAQGEPTLPSGYIAPAETPADPAPETDTTEDAAGADPGTGDTEAVPADDTTAAAAEQQ